MFRYIISLIQRCFGKIFSDIQNGIMSYITRHKLHSYIFEGLLLGVAIFFLQKLLVHFVFMWNEQAKAKDYFTDVWPGMLMSIVIIAIAMALYVWIRYIQNKESEKRMKDAEKYIGNMTSEIKGSIEENTKKIIGEIKKRRQVK